MIYKKNSFFVQKFKLTDLDLFIGQGYLENVKKNYFSKTSIKFIFYRLHGLYHFYIISEILKAFFQNDKLFQTQSVPFNNLPGYLA